jgi:Fanconi anemia group M protein
MFEEIFSAKAIAKKEKINIIADYREKNSMVISELLAQGIEIEFKQLPVADFLVKDVAIERKTVSDFISSMLNQRLRNQLEELQQYSNKLLLIEGIAEQELYNEQAGVNPNAIRGFLLSISLNHKIPIIYTKNYQDTAKFLIVLAKQEERGEIGIRPKKNLSSKEQIQFILEGFPGIGPVTAKKLLKKYKTLSAIFSLKIEELAKEIGKKAEIFELLKKEY